MLICKKLEQMTIHAHQYDIPEGLTFSGSVAVDTETMGLNPKRDRLCLVQLSSGDGDAHLVHFPQPRYDAPYLKQLLTDQNITKIFKIRNFRLQTSNACNFATTGS